VLVHQVLCRMLPYFLSLKAMATLQPLCTTCPWYNLNAPSLSKSKRNHSPTMSTKFHGMNDNLKRLLQTLSGSQTSQNLPRLTQSGRRSLSLLSTTHFFSRKHHSKTSFWGQKSSSALFKRSSIVFILRLTTLSKEMNWSIYSWDLNNIPKLHSM